MTQSVYPRLLPGERQYYKTQHERTNTLQRTGDKGNQISLLNFGEYSSPIPGE